MDERVMGNKKRIKRVYEVFLGLNNGRRIASKIIFETRKIFHVIKVLLDSLLF